MIGSGRVIKNEKGIYYEGTLPTDADEVCVLRKEDLEVLIRAEEMLMLRVPREMPKDLYGNRIVETRRGIVSLSPKVVDEILYTAPDQTQHKLFLDHHLYGANFKDMVWLRFANVDISMLEEEP